MRCWRKRADALVAASLCHVSSTPHAFMINVTMKLLTTKFGVAAMRMLGFGVVIVLSAQPAAADTSTSVLTGDSSNFDGSGKVVS